ncbi:MAG TPA: C1 family peptidase, partial [Ferruginibacter sp.]|nr:C1 family peptidase [Ferruginibacter sp.]
MPTIASTKGKGWLKDLPDFRDQAPDTDSLNKKQVSKGIKESVSSILSRVNSKKKLTAKKLSPKIDLRPWCSPIEDQGQLGSCTAHAGVSLYEYYEKRAFGRYIDGSRLFLYKATRNLLGWEADDGAYLRSTMAAMALFGIVPEKYWPYLEHKFNDEPNAFLYSYAQNYQAMLYYRLDKQGVTKEALLNRIREHLSNGLPSVFGFTCYSSLDLADDGKIPFPDKDENVDGGHAVMAVGYDDNMKIQNPGNKKIITT